MRYLKKRREELQWTQTEVALRCGMSRQHLNRLEAGRALASREQARLLRDLLGVPVLCADDLVGEREMRDLSGAAPYDLEALSPALWKAGWEFWGEHLVRMGIDRELWDWMSAFLAVDSSLECYALGQLVAEGARSFLGNPNQWGFDAHVVVDRLGRLLGERMLPGLIYRDKQRTFVFWPQVSLRTSLGTFRLDGLMFHRGPAGRHWLASEFDGRGHDPRGDEKRAGKLVMLEVRINGDEIRQRRTLPLLLERAEAAIAKAAVRAS